MTVKDLKAKLNNIPEEASVEIVMCANDNPLSDGYCLSDDILDYLLDKGIDPQAEG